MTRPARSKSQWFNLLSFLIGLALLAALIVGFGWRNAVSHLRLLGGWGIGAVLAIFVLTALLETAAWAVALNGRYRFAKLLGVQLAARSINSLTPLGEGGEILKVTMLNGPLPLADRIAAVLGWNWHQRTTKHALLLLAPLWVLFAGSLLMNSGVLWSYIAAALVATVPTVLLGIALFKGGPAIIVRLLRKVGLLQRLGDGTVTSLTEALPQRLRQQLSPSSRTNWWVMALLVGARVLSAVEIHLILIWLGVPVSLADSVLLYGATLIVRNLISISPVQLGVGEGGELFAFKLLALPLAAGLTQAVVRTAIRLVFTVVGLLVLGLGARRRRADYSTAPVVAPRVAVR